MLIRISLFVAILAALAVGAVDYFKVRDNINTLVEQRNGYHSERDQARNDLATTRKDLAKTQDTLKQTQQDLATAKKDLDAAVASEAAQKKRADELSDKLTQAAADRDKAQGELEAYKLTGYTPKQVTELGSSLKNAQTAIDALNDEKVVLNRKIERLRLALDRYEGTNKPIELRADLRGKILVVDPKWEFVVLNIGDDQGVKENGELLVSREGKLVAKVIVRSVERSRCIANIVPGWKLGEVIEGDDVTPAYPAS